MEQDAWGLNVHRPDHAADDELGYTCAEDGDWAPAEYTRAPVTRTAFAYVFAATTWGTLRWIVLTLGIHRRKPRP